MDKMDVVIVGAGLAGLSCAYMLADHGLQVIVVERGDFAGSKNVTGGRLYLKPIKDLAGDMLQGAPFERKVVRERFSLLGAANSISIDHTSDKFRNDEHSYTVLRARLDRWLSDRLMTKGVFIIPKYRVDDLLWENGAVSGIKAGTEEIPAHVVVAADGVLSFMGQKAGLRPVLPPGAFAVGMKEILALPEEKINDRFNINTGEGAAHLFLGDVTKGMFGGGFLYTNQDTISLGIVVGINAMMNKKPPIDASTLLDMFKERYEMRAILAGAKIVEYSAHVIPEAGHAGIGKLYGNGILLAGDAAGLALNMGITVRGMEFAIASGICAAQTIIKAREAGSFTESTLAGYVERLKETFVLKDLEAARNMPGYLENESLFTYYPQILPDLVEKIMWFDENPKERLGKTVWNGLKASGMLSMKRLLELYRVKNI
ncbi:MAG: Electron-transferring-flavoprotein dehydrogenase [Deltaproteobacteria bacterium]|nr:Electron-transferring-flavoprotein dehydrogenase [Deltaproteobacteria bacterium]